MNFVALDFETANSGRGSICQIGAVKYRNGEEVEQLNLLVRPEPFYMEAINESIHGISLEMVEFAPSFEEVWDAAFKDFIEGEKVICHNTSFDMYVLAAALDVYHLSYPQFEYECTLRLSKDLLVGQERHKLNVLAEEVLGCAFNHHDALDDARMCGLLYLYLTENYDVKTHVESKYSVGRFSPAGHSSFVIDKWKKR